MNETIKSVLAHRTIRQFKNQEIPENTVQVLLDAANMTPTSSGMQTCSIIRITSQDKKNALSNVGGQDYMKDSPLLLLFVADLFRNYNIAQEQGQANDTLVNIDKFLQAYTDAAIAAQNVLVCAESLGLGTCYFGNIHNDSQKVIDIFKLPKYTFPVVALGIGYIDREPMQKPRMDKSIKYFENEYKVFDSYMDTIKEFDKKMQDYYDLRENGKRSDKFSEQVVKKFTKSAEKRSNDLNVIKNQGILF